MLFNYPEFGDRLVIGKFCMIASGTKFIMGPANHRLSSVTAYPFNVFGGAWTENTPHLSQLPHKGDTISWVYLKNSLRLHLGGFSAISLSENLDLAPLNLRFPSLN